MSLDRSKLIHDLNEVVAANLVNEESIPKSMRELLDRKYHSLVVKTGKAIEWAIDDAALFCVLLLEDVNAHKASAAVDKLLAKMGGGDAKSLHLSDQHQLDSMVHNVAQQLEHDIFGAGAFCVLLLEDVNAHDESKKVDKLLLKQFQSDGLFEGVEYLGEASGTKSAVQHADDREALIIDGIKKLFKKYKVALDSNIHIDSRGEIFVGSKGTADQARGGKSPAIWPEALVALMHKNGFTARPGQNPILVRKDSRINFTRTNHFVWEKFLKAIGINKKELIKNDEDLWGKGNAKGKSWLDTGEDLDEAIGSLWMRVGDRGDYENYGIDFDAAAEHLAMLDVDEVTRWVKGGFEADEFKGRNYISLYWGDKDGNLVKDLSTSERKKFEKAMEEDINEAVDAPDQVKMIVVRSFKKVSSPRYGDYYVTIPDMSSKLKRDKAVAALLKKYFPDSTAAKDAAQEVFKNAKATVEDKSNSLASRLNQVIEGAMVIGPKSQIGQTIMDQMGGYGRLSAMLGINRLKYLPKGVAFGWPNKKRSKGNYVEITLRSDDTYNMEFSNLSTQGMKSVKKINGVYADQLASLFEKQTGWYLRLSDTERNVDSMDEAGKQSRDYDTTTDMADKLLKKAKSEITKLNDKHSGFWGIAKAIVGWLVGNEADMLAGQFIKAVKDGEKALLDFYVDDRVLSAGGPVDSGISVPAQYTGTGKNKYNITSKGVVKAVKDMRGMLKSENMDEAGSSSEHDIAKWRKASESVEFLGDLLYESSGFKKAKKKHPVHSDKEWKKADNKFHDASERAISMMKKDDVKGEIKARIDFIEAGEKVLQMHIDDGTEKATIDYVQGMIDKNKKHLKSLQIKAKNEDMDGSAVSLHEGGWNCPIGPNLQVDKKVLKVVRCQATQKPTGAMVGRSSQYDNYSHWLQLAGRGKPQDYYLGRNGTLYMYGTRQRMIPVKFKDLGGAGVIPPLDEILSSSFLKRMIGTLQTRGGWWDGINHAPAKHAVYRPKNLKDRLENLRREIMFKLSSETGVNWDEIERFVKKIPDAKLIKFAGKNLVKEEANMENLNLAEKINGLLDEADSTPPTAGWDDVYVPGAASVIKDVSRNLDRAGDKVDEKKMKQAVCAVVNAISNLVGNVYSDLDRSSFEQAWKVCHGATGPDPLWHEHYTSPKAEILQHLAQNLGKAGRLGNEAKMLQALKGMLNAVGSFMKDVYPKANNAAIDKAWKVLHGISKSKGYKESREGLAGTLDELLDGIDEAITVPKGAIISKGIYYFKDYKVAEEWAKKNRWPTDRIISYEKGWAVQLKKSGKYAGPGVSPFGSWRESLDGIDEGDSPDRQKLNKINQEAKALREILVRQSNPNFDQAKKKIIKLAKSAMKLDNVLYGKNKEQMQALASGKFPTSQYGNPIMDAASRLASVSEDMDSMDEAKVIGLFNVQFPSGKLELVRKGTMEQLNKWAKTQGFIFKKESGSLYGGYWANPKTKEAYRFDVVQESVDEAKAEKDPKPGGGIKFIEPWPTVELVFMKMIKNKDGVIYPKYGWSAKSGMTNDYTDISRGKKKKGWMDAREKFRYSLRNTANVDGKLVEKMIDQMDDMLKQTREKFQTENLDEATFYNLGDYVLIFKSFKQLEKFIGEVEDAHSAGELPGGGGGPEATVSFPVSYSLIGGWGNAKAVNMVLGKDAKLRKAILDLAKKVFHGVEVRKITKTVKLPDFNQLPPKSVYKTESLDETTGKEFYIVRLKDGKSIEGPFKGTKSADARLKDILDKEGIAWSDFRKHPYQVIDAAFLNLDRSVGNWTKKPKKESLDHSGNLAEYEGDLRKFMWTLAADAAMEAFKLMSRNTLSTEFYVWYLPQGEELRVAEDKPGSKWKLAINERIPISKTVVQIKRWIYGRIGRLPILKLESVNHLDEFFFGGGKPLVLMQYPTKRWGFVGNVPAELAWERKDGKPLTDEQVKEMVYASNPAMNAKSMGIKNRSFKTPDEARKAAKKAGAKITQDTSKGESLEFLASLPVLGDAMVKDEAGSIIDIRTAKLSPGEQDAAKQHIGKFKGQSSALKGVKFGQRVKYKGSNYLVYDFQAENKAPFGVLLILVSPDLKTMVSWVPVPDVFPDMKEDVNEAKVYKFKKGDKVRYKAAWLRNTGQYTGRTGQLKGVVTDMKKLGQQDLVYIKWDDGTDGKVIAPNLQMVGKPDYSDVDLAGTLNQIVEDVSVGLGEAREFVLDKLPPNTELFGHESMSTWDGKLAVVYEPFMTDYSASDFDPANMTRRYHLYYVDDGKGKPLDSKDWKDIVGNTVRSWGKGNFTISTRNRSQPMKGKLIEPGTIFNVKVKVKDLGVGEVRELRGYLTTTKNFFDATDLKRLLKIKDAKIFLSGKIKDIDTLYSVFGDAGLNTANDIYEFASFQAKDEAAEEKSLKKMLAKNGIFAMNSKQTNFRFIQPKSGKFESLEFDANLVEAAPEPGSFAAKLNGIVEGIGLEEAVNHWAVLKGNKSSDGNHIWAYLSTDDKKEAESFYKKQGPSGDCGFAMLVSVEKPDMVPEKKKEFVGETPDFLKKFGGKIIQAVGPNLRCNY